jgi:hypothetical protein
LSNRKTGRATLFGATYEVNLPDDYLHILNCVCVYKVLKNYKCYDAGDYVQFAAKKLTADSWSIILNDFYNRPLPERPYYYIHNVNTSRTIPTNPYRSDTGEGTDMLGNYSYEKIVYTIKKGGDDTEGPIQGVTKSGDYFVDDNCNSYSTSEYYVVSSETVNEGNSNLSRTIDITDINDKPSKANAVEKETAYRYGNPSKVRMEIRYGHDDTVFELESVLVDYIKTPQYIRLTQE